MNFHKKISSKNKKKHRVAILKIKLNSLLNNKIHK